MFCGCYLNIFTIFSIFIIGLCLIIKLVSKSSPKITRKDCEKKYFSFNKNEYVLFPNLIYNGDKKLSEANLYLSVIVPAYNEEKRLPKMLDETIDYLEKRSKINKEFTYEIIVVDDGSKDNTCSVVNQYSKKLEDDKIKLLKLEKNHGKGGAVRLGVLSSSGQLILFADADGASKFEDFQKLEDSLKKFNNFVAYGSRAHLEKDSIASRSIFRTFLMYGFHFIVWFFTVRSIKDTQCGFKLLKREIAIDVFNKIHVEGWAFDVELTYLLEYLNLKINEVAINWTEIEGSKIVPVFSWLSMGVDVLKISFMYTIKAWQLPSKKLIKKD